VLDAAEMKARGFLQHAVPLAALDGHAAQVVDRITALAPQAARQNKRTLRALRTRHDPLHAAGAERELAAAYRYAPAAEHREGVAAFLDKRKPDFR